MVKKSLARQLRQETYYFENFEVKVNEIDDKKQLMVRFNTTERIEKEIRNKQGQIRLPLDEATCNDTTSFSNEES